MKTEFRRYGDGTYGIPLQTENRPLPRGGHTLIWADKVADHLYREAGVSMNKMEFYQLIARRGALRLELKGLYKRGRTSYSICKEVYGIKGGRLKVLAQLNQMIEDFHKQQEEGNKNP